MRFLLLFGLLLAGVPALSSHPAEPASNDAKTSQHGLLPNTTLGGATSQVDPTLHVMDIRMPGVRPHLEDQYICSSFPMAGGVEYIVNYEALAFASRTHHLLLYGCETPASTIPSGCREMCQGNSTPKILYAWARNAPPTRMPPDVGFEVGSQGVRWIVLQIHYKTPLAPGEDPDRSGVRLTLSKQRQKYIAGIFLLLRQNLLIPPNTAVTHGDISCKYTGEAELYPFGFRVHSHVLGRVISGYQNNGTWSLLGKGNPQWPQAFYPIIGHHVIKKGDMLVARCTYDSTDRDVETHMGGRHTDEMCNFYMMYYTDATRGQSFQTCHGNTYRGTVATLPPGNDTPLPPNPALDERGTNSSGMHRQPSTPPSSSDRRDQFLPHKSASRHSAVVETPGWPAVTPLDHLVLGQVSGLGVDSHGNVHVFHRASRTWGPGSFNMMNKMDPAVGPITENTMLTFNPQGKVIKQWGAGMFFMPHGLHVDHEDNVWVTDVGLHQVFKFKKGSTTPSLTLGTRLEPGSDHRHYCKPTDVVTLTTGEFFVTDGYCNTRVLKYDRNGTLLTQWGTMTKQVGADNLPTAGTFDIPHSVTVVERRGWVCVADRENGRIQCFTTAGKFVKQFNRKEFAGRLFAVTYSNITDTLYAVNGPDLYNKRVRVRGFSIHPDTGGLMESWGPRQGLHNPHDLTVSPQGDFIYVAELDPHRVWRMYIHKEILEAQKHKKGGLLTRPGSVAGGAGDGEASLLDTGDLGASLVIGALLVVPVVFIVAVTVFMRLRKNGRLSFINTLRHRKNHNRRFNLGTLLSRKQGFSRINPDDNSDHELDHLNSDSDVEEYSATTRKA